MRQKLSTGPVVGPAQPKLPGVDPPPPPFTLVIQIHAWHIRERDHWGQTQSMRARKEELKRWHWVDTATCFHLEQRCRKGKNKNKQRAIITQPSSVATRGGVEDLRPQLQCRMKRCGQFWSTAGDEALLCLEGFWRNDRWHLLFPHAILTSVANN